MKNLRFALAASLLLVLGPGGASAQDINIDFGLPADAPASTYAAAGLPGVWNSIEATHTSLSSPVYVYDLVDVDGMPTGVILYQYGGMDLMSAADPSVSGDDAALLNDALISYSASLESCLFIENLDPGMYEIITYAWMPDAPSVSSRVRHDLSAMTVDVGGAWTGAHVEGVTFARHLLTIGSSGFLGSHSGVVPGMAPAMGAALNGMQIRRIYPGTDGGTGTDAASPGTDAAAPGTDAGVAPGTDAAGPGTDAGGGGGGGGCGCAVARSRGADSFGASAALVTLAGLMLVRRRRATRA